MTIQTIKQAIDNTETAMAAFGIYDETRIKETSIRSPISPVMSVSQLWKLHGKNRLTNISAQVKMVMLPVRRHNPVLVLIYPSR